MISFSSLMRAARKARLGFIDLALFTLEDRRTGGQEDRRTGGQEDRRTGVRRTGEQK